MNFIFVMLQSTKTHWSMSQQKLWRQVDMDRYLTANTRNGSVDSSTIIRPSDPQSNMCNSITRMNWGQPDLYGWGGVRNTRKQPKLRVSKSDQIRTIRSIWNKQVSCFFHSGCWTQLRLSDMRGLSVVRAFWSVNVSSKILGVKGKK